MAHANLVCPVCGKQRGVPLLWGFISPEVLERFLGRTVMFARAQDDDADSDAECLECGTQWSSTGMPGMGV